MSTSKRNTNFEIVKGKFTSNISHFRTSGRNVTTHRPTDRFPSRTDIVQMLERNGNDLTSPILFRKYTSAPSNKESLLLLAPKLQFTRMGLPSVVQSLHYERNSSSQSQDPGLRRLTKSVRRLLTACIQPCIWFDWNKNDAPSPSGLTM